MPTTTPASVVNPTPVAATATAQKDNGVPAGWQPQFSGNDAAEEDSERLQFGMTLRNLEVDLPPVVTRSMLLEKVTWRKGSFMLLL